MGISQGPHIFSPPISLVLTIQMDTIIALVPICAQVQALKICCYAVHISASKRNAPVMTPRVPNGMRLFLGWPANVPRCQWGKVWVFASTVLLLFGM